MVLFFITTMAASMVGGAFLSAFLQVLFDRMASPEVLDFVRCRKLNTNLLKKLKLTLLSIYPVLNDAEEKQITDPAVKEWLDELKDAVYIAEDLLDEIAFEASRCLLEARDEADSNQKDVLSLREGVGRNLITSFPTTSLVDDYYVFGRDEEKEAMINLLLSDDASDRNIGVVAIVGMGGVGKTTLAQLAYNDCRVNNCFEIKFWVCVSQEFDIFRITKTVLETISPGIVDIKDLNLLQVKLNETLKGKKFLIVLDDVWNENYDNWDSLRKPFSSGAQGSKIIVTTRNEGVASMMQTIPTRHLEELSESDSWLLFVKHALDNRNSEAYPNLEAVGRQIVKKCKGLPLAVKTLGGLLRSKQSLEEWNEIFESNIWDLPDDISNILPALRLSYLFLSSNLKQCFAYCAIFPKGYEFKKEELILMWMAEDLLHRPKGKKKMEDIGDEYFNHLTSRSFFQKSTRDKSRFIMHDLIHDLAKSVSGEFCHSFESEPSHKVGRKTRYKSFSREYHDNDKLKKLETFYEAKYLRTLLLSPSLLYKCSSIKVPNDLWQKFRCLRVLSLSNCHIKKLPDSVGNLKHLRYFDLSGTLIESLPSTVCTLFNLQTLLLLNCYCLIELPANIGRLINLRHLYISSTKLEKLPLEMNKLKNLQTLSNFVLGNGIGFGMGDLGVLQDLHGELTISGLQNIVHVQDASVAKLKDKKYIKKLSLEWSGCTSDSQIAREVLDQLQPHGNLQELVLANYGGTRCPDWLGAQSLPNLVSLYLWDCDFCVILPPLGQLPSLKGLHISGLKSVVSVGPEFYGNCSFRIQSFQCLEILEFSCMEQWQHWFFPDGERDKGVFPRLRELYIKSCGNLKGDIPLNLPLLKKLVINKCGKLGASLLTTPTMCEFEIFQHEKFRLPSNCCYEFLTDLTICWSLKSFPFDLFPNLGILVLRSCKKLESLTFSKSSSFRELKSLTHIEIEECPNFVSFPAGELPAPNLKYLTLKNCCKLKSLPERMHSLPSLTYLRLLNCPDIDSFPRGGLPFCLTCITINHCDKLVEQRMKWNLQRLTHLRYLMICSKFEGLESFPDEGLFPPYLEHLFLYQNVRI
ncbi:putative disease resistance RPP13-like protein 1 [Carica papaya]|uniref:putative disease resistance RPP13-like protein 1 n=1 Tax=Carica papaya TaxID=3649 RepID=UPI000B8CE753|nr:putative disease resistance RPP13-like protein 1 [Carica papaya]